MFTEPTHKHAADGLAQAKEYAQMLGLKFAYSSNGRGIVEFDFTEGTESELAAFPSPQELCERLTAAERIQTHRHRGFAAGRHIESEEPN